VVFKAVRQRPLAHRLENHRQSKITGRSYEQQC